jgi:hypothetical protein
VILIFVVNVVLMACCKLFKDVRIELPDLVMLSMQEANANIVVEVVVVGASVRPGVVGGLVVMMMSWAPAAWDDETKAAKYCQCNQETDDVCLVAD